MRLKNKGLFAALFSILLTGAGTGKPEWIITLPREKGKVFFTGSSAGERDFDSAKKKATEDAVRQTAGYLGLKVKTYYLQELKRMVRRLEEKTEIKGRATIENLQTEEVYSEKSADGSCSAWILLSCPESVLSRERMRLEEADRSQAKEIERLIAEGEGKLKSEELLPALSLFFLAFEMISESSAGDPLYWKLTERCRKVFNGIELEKVTAPVIVRTGMISDADLQVRFFYQKKPLPSIPVTFRFIDGHGEIDRRAETDSRGIARSALGKIYEPGRCRIEASFSLNGFLGKSFYEQELKRTVIFDMEAEGEKIPYTRTFSIEPLSNLTAQERYNWISQALAESLTFRLSQVPNVSIVKSPLDDVPYDYEIKGSFQVLGGEIEITIQAEDSSGDVTEAFQIKGPLESLLKLQEEITLELSDRLAFQISGTASNLPFTTSRQAFEAYAAGKILLRKQDYTGALGKAEEAIRYDPKFSSAHTLRAMTAGMKGKRELATASFRKAISLAPEQVENYIGLSSLCIEEKDFERAREIIVEGIERNKDDYYLPVMLALIYKQQGRKHQAVELLEKTIQKTKYFAPAWNELGLLYQSLGKMNEAETSFSEAVKISPRYVAAQNNLAAYYLKKHLDALALRISQHVLDMDPKNSFAWNNMGLASLRLGRNREAFYALYKALSLKPDLAEAHYNLALCCAVSGKTTEMWEYLEEALALGFSDFYRLKSEEVLEKHRMEPRWRALAEKHGFFK